MHFVSRDVIWLQSQFRVIFSEHAHTAIRDTLVIGPRSTSFTQSFVTVTAAAADDPESSKPTPYNPGHIKVSRLAGAVQFKNADPSGIGWSAASHEGIVKLLTLFGGCEDWLLWRLRRGRRVESWRGNAHRR